MKKRKTFSLYIKSLFTSFVFLLSACGSSEDTDKYLEYPTPLEEFQEMRYTPSKTFFKLWAPTAQEVRVLIYTNGESGHTEKMYPMIEDKDTGLWSIEVDRDLMGYFYTFNIKQNDIWQGDTPGIQAKAVGLNGKRAAIIDWSKTNPEGWNLNQRFQPKKIPAAIIYELHIRDFTTDNSSRTPQALRGKYLGVIASDTSVVYPAYSTGIDHLVELGITHVKLMPVFDFHGKDETITDGSNYNWGYDPLNFNVPEGMYSSDPKNPYARIREFKEMVLKLHQAGIKVIMDMSYAYANPANSNFQKTFPGYYFAQDANDDFILLENGKAKLATQRPWVGKFIIESMEHWAHEYHIDGFSLDQLDTYDPETLYQIQDKAHKLGVNILMGEAQKSVLRIPQEQKGGVREAMRSFATALRSNPNDSTLNSYLLGEVTLVDEAKTGLLGGVKYPMVSIDSLDNAWTNFQPNTLDAINYVSEHGGLLLSDYLDKSNAQSPYNIEKIRLAKLAYTYLLTAQGTPLLIAGEEFLRSKGGVYSSAKSEDSINSIDWGLKGRHSEFLEYMKGLIQLRKNHPAFHMIGNTYKLERDIEFIPSENPLIIGYRLKDYANDDSWEDIIVFFNTSQEATRVNLPEGRYIVVCKDGSINENGLAYAYGQAYVSGQSAMILYRTDKQVYIPQPVVVKDTVVVESNIRKAPKINIDLRPVAPKKVDIRQKIENTKIEK